MIGALAAVGAVLVAAPALLDRWRGRLHPADWARWAAAALVAGLAAIEAAAMLAAAPTVLRAAGVHRLADACARMAGAVLPGGAAIGWLAASASVLLPALGAAAVVGGRRTQRRIARAAAMAPPLDGLDPKLRLAALDEQLAFSVPGRDGGQVVVSRGLLAALTHEQLAAVVRHERAHLRHRHGTYLLLTAAVETSLALHPLARRSTAALRCTLERWADEEAAGGTRRTRQATRAALIATALSRLPARVMGFGPVETIVGRVAALDRPAPRTSRWLRLATSVSLGLVVGIGMVTAGAAGGRLWAALTMPVTCPVRPG